MSWNLTLDFLFFPCVYVASGLRHGVLSMNVTAIHTVYMWSPHTLSMSPCPAVATLTSHQANFIIVGHVPLMNTLILGTFGSIPTGILVLSLTHPPPHLLPTPAGPVYLGGRGWHSLAVSCCLATSNCHWPPCCRGEGVESDGGRSTQWHAACHTEADLPKLEHLTLWRDVSSLWWFCCPLFCHRQAVVPCV